MIQIKVNVVDDDRKTVLYQYKATWPQVYKYTDTGLLKVYNMLTSHDYDMELEKIYKKDRLLYDQAIALYDHLKDTEKLVRNLYNRLEDCLYTTVVGVEIIGGGN